MVVGSAGLPPACKTPAGCSMKSAIAKRSVVLRGHKTSVSLEKEFWEGLREIAEVKNAALSSLLQQIDTDRRYANLSSAIRIFVFEYFRRRAGNDPTPGRHDSPRLASPSAD